MIPAFFLAIKKTESGEQRQYTTFISNLKHENSDVLLIKKYFEYPVEKLKEIFSQIMWLNEDDYDFLPGSLEQRRFRFKYGNGNDVKYLLIFKTVDGLNKYDMNINEMVNKKLLEFKKKETRTSGKKLDDFARIELRNNVDIIDGEKKILIINEVNYLQSPDWTHGFVFDLDNDTLEIHSKELMDLQGKENIVKTTFTRQSSFDENAFQL
jgi:hypothetical protein